MLHMTVSPDGAEPYPFSYLRHDTYNTSNRFHPQTRYPTQGNTENHYGTAEHSRLNFLNQPSNLQVNYICQ